MSKIKILDESTIQQIAAGEVIERPSSIVKELIENSIDAGADDIIIEIANGGKSYIRVTDNGEGMDKEDIRLAFKRHSTSKLKTVGDIYNVLSLGFRGEALASISSVSKLEVLSKTETSNVGVQTFIKDGEIVGANKIGCPKGTTIIVRDIFYNLPVRQKFLKSSSVESNHISETINKLALGNFKISFKLIKDGKITLKTPRNNNLENTIYSVLGKDYYNNLVYIDHTEDKIKINGFLSNNKLYRANRKHQYLYINGRYISHLDISKIIEKEYKSLIPLNRLPVFILNMHLNPNEIDINIHPTKQEVKFVDSKNIYNIITKVVKERLMSSVTIPEMSFINQQNKAQNSLPKLFNSVEKNFENEKILQKHSKPNHDKYINKSETNIIIKDLTLDKYIKDKKDKNVDADISQLSNKSSYLDSKINTNEDIDINENITEQKIDDILLDIKPIGRVFNTYIIAESRIDEKLFFIDQHAAHERIMYERYRKEFSEEKITIQQLLYPEIIEFTNKEIEVINENKDIFKKLGFLFDAFGENSIALRGVPMLFGEPKVRNLFLDILDRLEDNIENNYEVKIDKIMKISCTNAIKSGDKIDNLEIMALFNDLQKCENPYTCPHGRPTITELSKKDIEKQFLRIM
ncbi:MAG: DNA mismatch repair endonuclease MutL [Tissierella sp.]|uniref:DNA mismatch repair endonuclease MutL n=1 Tax=Tissierella sp. TaxID=41274 RepID=UPI003F98A61F